VAALDSAYRLPQVTVPLVKDIPLAGTLLSGHSLYVYGGWLLLAAAWIVLYKTPFGYRLRACEKHGEALRSLGIQPGFYCCAAFLICGLCCGIGGSFLSLNLGVFVPGMSAGRGWIALVVIFLGGRRPQGIFAAAFVYALADAFSNYAQGVWKIPADFILAFPYAFTFAAMIVVSIRAKRGLQLP
jgi:simple sugar transport system permease protein